jgi:hypothetical protein
MIPYPDLEVNLRSYRNTSVSGVSGPDTVKTLPKGVDGERFAAAGARLMDRTAEPLVSDPSATGSWIMRYLPYDGASQRTA